MEGPLDDYPKLSPEEERVAKEQAAHTLRWLLESELIEQTIDYVVRKLAAME